MTLSFRPVLLLLICAVLLVACWHHKAVNASTCRLSVRLCQQMAHWKNDKGGCNHLRNRSMAQFIVDSLPADLRNVDSMLRYLGPADEESGNGEFRILNYYYHSTCNNGRAVDSADQQWIEFVFTPDGKFKSMGAYAE